MSRSGSAEPGQYNSPKGRPRRSGAYSRYSGGADSGRDSAVLCDFCVVKKSRAVKSCLTCLTSCCETHLQAHYEYPALMKHKLVTATGQLREKICAEHDKLLEVYCRTDQSCVCVLCIMDEHKNHDVVTAAAERTEKQKQLGMKLATSQQKVEERVKKWQEIRQAVESLKHSSQTVLDENERVFTELLRALERRHAEVRALVQAQEAALVNRAEAHLNRLEEEITLLRKKHTDLEQLSHSDDHIHFLQSWQSLSGPSGYEDLAKISLAPNHSFDEVRKAIAELKVQVEDVSRGELNHVSAAVKEVHILRTLEPKTREEFLEYYLQLSFDPSTAHPNLQLSDGNTVVRMSSGTRPVSDHPDRFNHWQQVLCREGVTGNRCYWEADWTGTEVDIAVTYRGINRKGDNNACSFGWNDKSWSLYCSESKYSFTHNSKSAVLATPKSSRIGVYVDHRAGTIAFYSVSDTMTLLHRVQTSFTEPLYPGFGVWGYGSTIKL